MRRQGKVGFELQFGTRIQSAFEPSNRERGLWPAAVIDQVPVAAIDDDAAATQPPRFREAGVELAAMIGYRVMGGLRDCAADVSLFTIHGILSGLKSGGDRALLLVIDGNTKTAPIIPMEGITGGDVWPGTVEVRYGALEFTLHRVSDGAEAAKRA